MAGSSRGTGSSLVAVLGIGLVAGSCSSAKIGLLPKRDGGGDRGSIISGGDGKGVGILLDLDASVQPPPSPDADYIQKAVSCDSGAGCTCPPFNVAVIGKPGKWGTNPQGDSDGALQDWLNTSSVGTAKVDNIKTRPTLTEDFLKKYNVIILASLSDDSTNGPWWEFTPEEVAAFQAWVEKGGGVISMSGYAGSGDEVAPLNQLIEFSGITYNKDSAFATCGATDPRVCDCSGSKTLCDFNLVDPVVEKLGTDVTLVGLENGRSINAPPDGHVAATVPGNKNALVGKVVGQGHVLAYADEWISYTSQWTGAGNPRMNDPGCAGRMPQDNYQTAQFWFNMIKWSQPTATCFKLVDSTQHITIW